jgi:hypothetical protein
MKNQKLFSLQREFELSTKKLVEITNVNDIEIGDTLQVRSKGRILDEGAIEFIDFTIPMGNVLITINKKEYSGSLNFYLVQKGERTPEQLLIKSNRLNQVMNRQQACDNGHY